MVKAVETRFCKKIIESKNERKNTSKHKNHTALICSVSSESMKAFIYHEFVLSRAINQCLKEEKKIEQKCLIYVLFPHVYTVK